MSGTQPLVIVAHKDHEKIAREAGLQERRGDSASTHASRPSRSSTRDGRLRIGWDFSRYLIALPPQGRVAPRRSRHQARRRQVPLVRLAVRRRQGRDRQPARHRPADVDRRGRRPSTTSPSRGRRRPTRAASPNSTGTASASRCRRSCRSSAPTAPARACSCASCW